MTKDQKVWLKAIAPYARRHILAGKSIEEAVVLAANEYQDVMVELRDQTTARAKKAGWILSEQVYTGVKREG